MFYILKTSLHFENKPKVLQEDHFLAIIHQALKVVLGEFGASKYLEILSYEPTTLVAELKIEKSDLHLIWAALSVYGNHFGQRIAFHIDTIAETTE